MRGVVRLWVRQHFGGKNKPWHIWGRCLEVNIRRSEFAREPWPGKVCVKCQREAERDTGGNVLERKSVPFGAERA